LENNKKVKTELEKKIAQYMIELEPSIEAEKV
jgi:hypothetical protein